MADRNSRTRGYAFLIMMMMVTILLISLTAALPSVYTAGQREKEEELIFRGNEYARAIMFFHRKFGRYPSTMEELSKKTNGIRFLRHMYTDPISRNGKWRLIHANGQGMILDSKTSAPPTGPGPRNLQGSQGFQGFQNPPGSQTQPNPQGTAGDSSQNGDQGGSSSSFTNTMHGAFIIGVASNNHKTSIRIWNNRTHYDEWEFLGTETALGGGTIGQPVQTPGVGPGQGGGIGPGSGGGTRPGSGGPPTPVIPPLSDQSNLQ